MDFQSKSKAAFPWEQGFREGKLHNASGVCFAAFHKISHYLNSDVFMSYMDKRSYCSEHVFIWTSLLLELVLFSWFFFSLLTKSEQKCLLLQFCELHANGSFYTSIVSLITLMITGELKVIGWFFGKQIRIYREVSTMSNFIALCYQKHEEWELRLNHWLVSKLHLLNHSLPAPRLIIQKSTVQDRKR